MEKIFDNIKWKKNKDAYNDISFATTFNGLESYPLYVELRVYPSGDKWKSIALFTDSIYGGTPRKLTLKTGSYNEVVKYINLLSKDNIRSSKLIRRLLLKKYFKGSTTMRFK